MSYESVTTVNMIAGEDLRGDVFELLTVENDGGIAKVVKTTGPTQTAIGVLAENPRTDASTDGLGVPVTLLFGKTMMKAGGNITAGQLLVADTDAGRVVGIANVAALAADTMAVGIALESAVDGDVFSALGMPLTSATET